MMKKILVPTDFSSSSKSGIRFAINWLAKNSELIFVHVLNTMKPSTWSDEYFEKYCENENKSCIEKLTKFVLNVYEKMNIRPSKHQFIVLQSVSADLSIIQYCKDNPDISLICISTRGAGKFVKWLGTNTGNLITKATVPVLSIPGNYKLKPLTKILYAADLKNYSKELDKVLDFSAIFKASVDIVHFTWPNEVAFDEQTLNHAFKRPYKYGLQVHFEKNDAIHSFIQNLQRQIALIKPSIVVLFSNKERTIFQKIFLSSNAEQLSFQIKVPLLVYSKD